MAQSSNAFANATNPNSGNGITDRSSTRVRHAPGGSSSFSFGWQEPEAEPPARAAAPAPRSSVAQPADEPPSTPNRMNVLEERLSRMGPVSPQQGAPMAQVVIPAAASAPAPPVGTVATNEDMQKMTIQEMRTIMRERSLNPGGGKGDLIERYFDAVKAGQCAPKMVNTNQAGAANLTNNYSRPDGQNTGNFLTERNSSRVLAPPGGRSSVSFGDENVPAMAPKAKNHRHGDGGSSIVF